MNIYQSNSKTQTPCVQRQMSLRYGALSENLNGLKLHPRQEKPANLSADFFLDAQKGRMFGRWSLEEIAKHFQETGVFAQWHKQGHRDIWIEMEAELVGQRYALSVWTDCCEHSEMLVYLIVWLEYVEIDKLNASLAALTVEHLRLQNPRLKAEQLAPGQDFAPSGILRPVFGLIKYWASVLGAEVILQIPEYFHSAMLFAQHFHYIDDEMAQIFKAVQRQLLTDQKSQEEVIQLSKAFEAGKICCNNSPYLWPTEMMAYGLSHALQKKLQTKVLFDLKKYVFTYLN